MMLLFGIAVMGVSIGLMACAHYWLVDTMSFIQTAETKRMKFAFMFALRAMRFVLIIIIAKILISMLGV